MAVSEVVDKNVHQPFPRSWLLVSPLLELKVQRSFLSNFAVWIATKSYLQTNNISSLFVQERVDDGWSSVMDKSLASRLDDSVEKLAEFGFYKGTDIF